MDENRFEKLLEGDEPTVQEFATFVGVIEQLHYDELWDLYTSNPNLCWILKTQLSSVLRKKVQKINMNNAVESIVHNYRNKTR